MGAIRMEGRSAPARKGIYGRQLVSSRDGGCCGGRELGFTFPLGAHGECSGPLRRGVLRGGGDRGWRGVLRGGALGWLARRPAQLGPATVLGRRGGDGPRIRDGCPAAP